MTRSLVIINDFNVVGIAIMPAKTDAPLIIDADAVLSLSVTREYFQTIARRDSQFTNLRNLIQMIKLAKSNTCDGCPSPALLFPEQVGGLVAFEVTDHTKSVSPLTLYRLGE